MAFAYFSFVIQFSSLRSKGEEVGVQEGKGAQPDECEKLTDPDKNQNHKSQ